MMTFISMRPAYIKRSISFVDRFTIQRSFYYFAYSIQLIDRYIELLLLLDPRPNLLAYTSFSTQLASGERRTLTHGKPTSDAHPRTDNMIMTRHRGFLRTGTLTW